MFNGGHCGNFDTFYYICDLITCGHLLLGLGKIVMLLDGMVLDGILLDAMVSAGMVSAGMALDSMVL